ncbi:phosphoenolpyruvate synthase [Pelagibaculum spongiae]|uniref:Phosphoenolpyruvate synthase n=1 Tax=Pelagibaculum spongiae TaxID=2080658 RepID=A0A2V1H5C6_9GAMM|nr:phosphoenolpyruvate synthase [Pelagibaculum spongiae]PVZ72458.1 phosphoenolpyruvate synthase [Pelagibaculum spongiae]
MTYKNTDASAIDQPNIVTSQQAASLNPLQLGGKADNLAWLDRNGFMVPDFRIITCDALAELFVLSGEIKHQLNQLKNLSLMDKRQQAQQVETVSKQVNQLIMQSAFDPEIEQQLAEQIDELLQASEHGLSVRSSAVGEDSASASFAGQLESLLFQKTAPQVFDAIRQVYLSAFAPRALLYRLQHKLPLNEARAAIILQTMIDSESAGVIFTANPANGNRKQMLISATFGQGEGVVSGEGDCDEFTIGHSAQTNDKNNLEEVISHRIENKQFSIGKVSTGESSHGKDQGGTETRALDPLLTDKSCLDDQQIIQLRDQALKIAQLKQSPQDIEWCFANQQLYILQTRPVTSLPAHSEEQANPIVWDNSNIQESYCGVTTPLTYSFALRGYSTVYQQTYRLLGLSEKNISKMRPALTSLLGLIHGRIYYNINNWYRALLILPGFEVNKADMERMMGLQDPVDLVEENQQSLAKKLANLPRKIWCLGRLLYGFKTIDSRVAKFRDHFESVYATVDRNALHTMSISELMALIDHLQSELMDRWQTPIINDFNVMMMNGKVHRWLGKLDLENPELIQNNLMSGEEGIESTEPTKFLLRLCDQVRQNPATRKLIETTDKHRLLDCLQIADPEVYLQCQEYIERYGDRCMGELKLESITLRQDASFIFSVMKNFLSRDDLTLDNLSQREQQFRTQTEKEIKLNMNAKLGTAQWGKFYSDLVKLRAAVKNRENMRLARTRAFGLMRDIYAEIGQQLALYKVLDDQRDVFYLTVDELDSCMEGKSVSSDWKALTSARKQEYQAYQQQEIPHHFHTNGPVYFNNQYLYPFEQPANQDDLHSLSTQQLSGIGCYPGKVQAQVRKIFSPDDELNLNGKILCTVRTDPGWAPLFPTCSGLLVERGSTLSHSAVVARELGIPAIVNIPGLTQKIADGEQVIMDGASGIIDRLDVPQEKASA